MVGTPAEKAEVRMRFDAKFFETVKAEADNNQLSIAAFIRLAVAEKMQRIAEARAKGKGGES